MDQTAAYPLARVLLPRLHHQTVLFGLVVLVGAALVLPPLVFLVLSSVSLTTRSGALAGLTLEHYLQILSSARTLPLLGNTLLFGAGSALLSMLLGGLLAFAVKRTNAPGARLVYLAMVVMLATPGIVYAIGWFLLLSPRGILNTWAAPLTGGAPFFNVHSLAGMVFVEGLNWVPLVFFLLAPLFGAMDPALEESAYASGAGRGDTLRRITLPLLAPGLLSLFLLNFIRGLEAFEIPAVIGLPGRVQVIVSEVFLLVKDYPPDYGVASAFCVLLVGLVAASLYGYRRVTRHAERFQVVRGRGYAPRAYDLGPWRYPLGLLLGLILLVVAVLPLASVVWASLPRVYQVPSQEAFSRLSLDAYAAVLSRPTIAASVRNSCLLAAAAATLIMLLTTLAAWLIARVRGRGIWLADVLLSLPLVFPGVVVGVALIRTYVGAPVPIYGSLWILLVAYVTSLLPYGMRFSQPAMLQIHHELEESAYLSGATWWQNLASIVLPLMRGAFFGGWLYIFIVAFRELSRSIMLYSPDAKVVSVTLFELLTDGQLRDLGALSTLLTLVLLPLAILAQRLGARTAER